MKQEFKELRKLLEMQWTQGTFARDVRGRSVDFTDPTAVSFCIEGGVAKIAKAHGIRTIAMHDVIHKELGSRYIPSWNDARNRKLEEVLGLIDRCIESVD